MARRRFPNNDWIYATDAQEAYIRLLRNQAFPFGTVKWGPKDAGRRYLKSEVPKEIEMLKAAIAEGKAERELRDSTRRNSALVSY